MRKILSFVYGYLVLILLWEAEGFISTVGVAYREGCKGKYGGMTGERVF